MHDNARNRQLKIQRTDANVGSADFGVLRSKITKMFVKN